MSILDLSLPEKSWPIWVVALSLPATIVATGFVYYPLLGRSGTLDPYADTIAIPMYGVAIASIPIAFIVLILTSLCLVSYSGRDGKVFSWNQNRPFWSAFFTFILGVPATIVGVSTVYGWFQMNVWYEYLWDLSAILSVVWLLLIRGAIVSMTMKTETQ